jgi:hypothetical protein
MAKTSPGIAGKISGSVGGTQFRSTRYGNVLCETTIPVSRYTPPKQKTTQRFSNASRLWAKVRYEDVQQWNKLGDTFKKVDKLGNKYSQRGLDLFKQVNRQLVEINEPVILKAPKKVFPKDLIKPEFEIIKDGTLKDIRLHFNKPIHKDTKYIIFATPLMKYGRNSPKDSWFRTIAIIDSTFFSGYSLLNEYLTVFQFLMHDYYRISFRIKPVSKISGLTLPVLQIFSSSD